MTAKQTLITALAEHCRRNTPSMADAHVADAIEALIDERIALHLSRSETVEHVDSTNITLGATKGSADIV